MTMNMTRRHSLRVFSENDYLQSYSLHWLQQPLLNSRMPGLRKCQACCEGCQLRRCCRPCSLDHPWIDLMPHLCEHCLTLFDEWKMTFDPLFLVRLQIARIRYSHALKLKQDAELRQGPFSTLPDENSSDENPWSDLASSGH